MDENEKIDQNEFAAPEEEISFNPETEQEQNTEDKVKQVKKKKKAKWYFIIPAAFLVVFAIIFIGWYIVPKKGMNVCVLDKTILTVEEDNDINIDSIYRKHQGLFWLLEQQKYVFQNGDYYQTEKDYYGPLLNDKGQIIKEKPLSGLDYTPDLMYVSDVYGAVNDTYGYYNNSDGKNEGISIDDMSVISYAYEDGATVVAEMELFNSGLNSEIYSQLSNMCGVNPTGWVGRYIYDLQDFTDVPDWAPPMYEQQEGVEWQFSGPGILLVSAEKIIILEQKTDFESKNLLSIYINKDYEKEFKHCDSVNFYNWFEIVEPTSNSEVIANFEFDVNATGMEKLKGVLKSPRFTAITRKNVEGKAPVYYFAGDFNDYVSHQNYNRFLFANTVYRWIAFDRQGDISNFFWNFYNPFMTKVLSGVRTREIVKTDDENTAEKSKKDTQFKVTDSGFQLKQKNKWKDITLKTVSINATEPGKNTYSRNYEFYENLVAEAVALNANCIYAKDILPPEFYRAVYSNNSKKGSTPIYVIQNIKAPEKVSENEWKNKAETAVKILNGEGSYILNGSKAATKYFIDISDYVAAITFEGYDSSLELSYKGNYASAKGTKGYSALIYDTIQNCSKKKYGKFVPVGIYTPADMIKGSGLESDGAFSIGDIVTNKDCIKGCAFSVISYKDAENLINLKGESISGNGDKYKNAFSMLNKASGKRLLINGIGFSSNCGMGPVSATTEKSQGQQTVALLKSANSAGVLCAVASDLNDDWSAVSDSMYAFTTPIENNCMWQNVADPAQTTGFVALDAIEPDKVGVNMTDDDRVQMLSLSANEGYFYITAQFLDEIDYEKEHLFMGIDTYQRNDGEYYYSKEYTPTSLSGMEYVLSFEGKQNATLYVVSSYDRYMGQYVSKESYSGSYNVVSKLTYGGFSSGDNQFYQTGSTIYIRIPWSWLNVADPSQKIVINNEGQIDGQAKTVTTNGAVMSVMIADRATKDQLYLFPESKQEPSYKTFKWATWDTASYVMREKESFVQIKKYFSNL